MSAARKIQKEDIQNIMYMNRHKLLTKRFKCSMCGFPTATKKGRRIHYARSHQQSGGTADRNWEIYYLYSEGKKSVEDISKMFDLHPATVRRVIWRAIAFPGIYDLEG